MKNDSAKRKPCLWLWPSLLSCRLSASDRRLLKRRLTELETHTRLDHLKNYIQHGDTSCYMHSLAVAYVSFFIVRKLHLHCHFTSLLIGALLHDYFLYDWHDRNKSVRWHGFRHPGIALKNAVQDWRLDTLEADIIKHHMFPLTPVPPTHRESIVVCIADKLCSTYEFFRKGAYGRLKRELHIES